MMYREIECDIENIADEQEEDYLSYYEDDNKINIDNSNIKNIKYPLLRQRDVLIEDMSF
ncbi:MAG TPA: hypothetical protein VMZ91_06040 [Candidatus Paceibacterota bacterium]|nr:hypothetical protein [Candidatus Paceibacterota bacterium]